MENEIMYAKSSKLHFTLTALSSSNDLKHGYILVLERSTWLERGKARERKASKEHTAVT